ncbi:hypothetical protein SEA_VIACONLECTUS_82 [Gordonia phage ViaConlectus]|uniref:Uncharacterized protein n=1 Tax=Gordonia phage ViaConlectus TaxID=2972515 RepID=A0A976UF82_9CAUD|nr:hypothetical protein SEA_VIACONLECTUS_82 [Gordonia phage ViaConlectus]
MNNPYASECSLCGHLVTEHRLVPYGHIVEGPYACTLAGCDCRIDQTTPTRRLTEAQVAAREQPPRCPASDYSDRRIGRLNMRLRVLCELDDGHDGPHRSTFPDGTVWQWGEIPSELPNLTETIRAGGVDDDGLDNVTGTQLCRDCGHARREHYRGRATCMYGRPDSLHGFDCSCGEYVEPVVLEQPVPELVAAEVACAWCDAIYPDESHDPQCATYGTLTPLENRIAETIHAHAFVPLHDRYAIARHLLAEGWRPRT